MNTQPKNFGKSKKQDKDRLTLSDDTQRHPSSTLVELKKRSRSNEKSKFKKDSELNDDNPSMKKKESTSLMHLEEKHKQHHKRKREEVTSSSSSVFSLKEKEKEKEKEKGKEKKKKKRSTSPYNESEKQTLSSTEKHQFLTLSNISTEQLNIHTSTKDTLNDQSSSEGEWQEQPNVPKPMLLSSNTSTFSSFSTKPNVSTESLKRDSWMLDAFLPSTSSNGSGSFLRSVKEIEKESVITRTFLSNETQVSS